MRFTAFLFIISLGMACSSNAGAMKVATVDMRKVFDAWGSSTHPVQNIERLRRSMENENAERLKAINQRKAAIERISREANERGENISPGDKMQLEQEFLNASLEMRALEQNRQDFLNETRRRLKNEEAVTARLIIRRINETIQAYAAEKKYHMVIETGGYTTRNLPLFLHLEGAVDISDKVIARLNRNRSD